MNGNGKRQETSLDDGFDAVVRYGSTTVEFHPGGLVVVKAEADIEAYTNGAVHVHPAIGSTTPSKAGPQPGDRMQDGTIYAGLSPDTGEPMYTTPADVYLVMKWKAATKYADQLDAHGHHDWRVPTDAELNVLYENRNKGALKGTFNLSGSLPAGLYWSSTDDVLFNAETQRFSDGNHYWSTKSNLSSLRCVR